MKLFRLRRRENLKNGEFSNVETIPTTLDAGTSNEVQKLKISKANRGKKIFFGIIIASALFAIAYFLPNIYNVGFDPIKTYEAYTTYIIFLYISIILISICATTHSRFSKAIMILLLLVNFFWLASFFTQDILGISTIEFYALTILFLLGLATTYIRNRLRYPLIVLIGIPFIIILLNHVLPLYSDKPDFQGFYNSQITMLNVQAKNDAKTLQESETKITIKPAPSLAGNNATDHEKTVDLFGKPEQLDLGISGTQITFSSKTGIQNTYAYITFPQGTIITLYPQSAVEIQQREIDIIQGKVGIYTPADQSGYLILTGDLTQIVLNDTGNIQNFIDGFIAQRNTYFINQIGGEIMLNPTIDSFIGRYIDLANSTSKILQNVSAYLPINLSISGFDQNKLNYDGFHTYLDYGTRTAYEAATGSTQRIERDTQKGRDSTNIKARRDTLQTTVNGRFGKQ